MAHNRQMSEAYLTGVILAAVGGYLDAYTYFCRGHVFANAQTGNIVLLGIKIADGAWSEALYYFIPIAAFFIGILMAERIKSRFGRSESIHWRQVIIGVEAAVLVSVAFIPRGRPDALANALVSFVCSLQVEAFRKVNGNPFATTMCTGNLRSATERLYHYRQTRDKTLLHTSLQYYGIILFFIVGAIAGSMVTKWFAEKSVLICCGALAIVFFLMFQQVPSKRTGNSVPTKHND